MEEGAARGRSVSRLNVLIASTAAIIGLIYGYDLGSIASALLFLVPAFELSTFMTSVVTSAVVLGQLFGALFAGLISNSRLLRRRGPRANRELASHTLPLHHLGRHRPPAGYSSLAPD